MAKRSYSFLAAAALFALLKPAALLAEKIQDNSFLIEEAYNQEYGVVQHIQMFQYNQDHSWDYSFTQEWPVPDERNQLSYSIPVNHITSGESETGIGDVELNYRRQIVNGTIAIAPRLTAVLPTGNSNKNLGRGSVGIQMGLPISVEFGDDLVTHWNAGLTYTPYEKGPIGARGETIGYNVGASAVWTMLDKFNPLLEILWTSNENVEGRGITSRFNTLFINPGFRFAIDIGKLQIVPGVSAPIGVGPSNGDYGVLFYLSFEHPFMKAKKI